MEMDSSDLMQQFSMMMSCMQVPAASVEKFTNKSFLLKCQMETLRNATGMQGVKIEKGIQPVGKSKKVNLDPADMVDITTLSKNINVKLDGKFLLCRNISPPCEKMTSLLSVVDEPEGEKAVRIVIYNFTLPTSNVQGFLPVGRILAIKNPFFKQTMDGGYFVRIDDSADIISLTEESFQNNFQGVQWKSEIPTEYESFLQTENPSKTFEDWKNEGNKFFVQKNFHKAVNCYSEALKMCSKNVDILANRAAAYINLEYYIRGLEDSERAVEIQNNHLKGIFRKARCLGELNRYDDAISFLLGKLFTHSELGKSTELKNLLEKLRRKEKESQTGKYDIVKLFENPTEYCKEIAEFVGPVKIENILRKGRGLIASEDIAAGRLLLISKAFAIIYPESASGSDNFNFSSHDKLVHKIADKLTVEPELGHQLYQLYAGTDMNLNNVDFNTVDMKRINEICTYNCFGANVEKVIGKDKESVNLKGKDQKSCGIWIRPAYINHSCWDCNAFWMTFGDVMIIRACKFIPQGQEILMPYINPTELYEKRKLLFKKHDFLCDCIICQVDRSESDSHHQKRKTILAEIDKKAENHEELAKLVTKLEKIRAVQPNLNLSMVFPLRMLGLHYLKNGQFKNAAQQFIKAHAIIDNSPLIHFAANYAQYIVTAFIYDNDETEMLKWVEILKRSLRIAYGSLEIIKLIGKETYSKLQQSGITFDELEK